MQKSEEGKRGPSVQVLGAGGHQGKPEDETATPEETPIIESVEQGLSQTEPLLVDALIGDGRPLAVKAMADTGNRVQNVLNDEVADLLEEQWQLPKLKLRKPMELCGFNGHPVPPAGEMMLLPLQIEKHRETMAPCIITKSKYPLILSKGWMAAHGAIADPVHNQLLFVYDVCQHPGAVTAEALDSIPYSSKTRPTEFLNPHTDRQGNLMMEEAPAVQILKRTQAPCNRKGRNVPRADMVQDLRQLQQDVEQEEINMPMSPIIAKIPKAVSTVAPETAVCEVCLLLSL